MSLASLCYAYKLTKQGLLWSPQPNVERQTCVLVGYGQVANLRIIAPSSMISKDIALSRRKGRSVAVWCDQIEGRILREMKTALSAVLAAVGIQDKSCKATSIYLLLFIVLKAISWSTLAVW